MKITQITLNDWMKKETRNPISLLELPFSVSDIENISKLSFYEHPEDGLGMCYSCFVRIDDQEIYLRGFMERDSKKIGVVVSMHSSEMYPDSIIKKICKLFNVKLNDLRWIENSKNIEHLREYSRMKIK